MTEQKILIEAAQALENYLDTHYCRLPREMASRQEWTEQKPTVKGYYWWCEFRDVMPVYIGGETVGHLWAWANGYEYSLDRMIGFWMGPLDVPNPPEA